ncbi:MULTISPECIES: hypothetical protein [unclassified Actinomyces]|uniref:hypothetical protein n=1 Tax=unclassified Actinomyces TaxID=2609248 RepID=UPI0020175848|nr:MULTISPECIES: hypothetical protein [unclassified Actinomyces]MCL3776630.1 hypothetical protein [Actinomyces sp. AC-20-1]MCL3790276.1 hypothetical protein [Actinomyces sp. 187325]MCL3791909.1 hypothetical protein [Actinomyces sp. 186855]MCL3795070.1 hypothetical protein [Actinomyces sp. 217892]
MTSDAYTFPVAISRLTEGETSREPQIERAIRWLLERSGRSVIVVTPQKRFDSESLKQLAARPGVTHLSWRGLSLGSLSGHRVLYAWPDREHLNKLWDIDADALVVVEWDQRETAEWIEDANPVQLFQGYAVDPQPVAEPADRQEPLPNGVGGILEYVTTMSAGYSSGLKWNEIDKLKADMMNRPDRWVSITVDQVRAKCRELGMRPDDIDTVTELLQRRKEGRRFNVQGSYRKFQFN